MSNYRLHDYFCKWCKTMIFPKCKQSLKNMKKIFLYPRGSFLLWTFAVGRVTPVFIIPLHTRFQTIHYICWSCRTSFCAGCLTFLTFTSNYRGRGRGCVAYNILTWYWEVHVTTNDWLIVWCLTPFQQYFSYIVAASAPNHAFLELF